MAKVNAKHKKKINKNQKKIVLIVLCVVVALSMLSAVFFGFKLYAYGKDVKVIYNANGGKLSSQTDVVEVCKKYTLDTPKQSGYKFLYWSTDGKATGKVATSGLWLTTTKNEIRLYAVWEELEDEWTKKNY